MDEQKIISEDELIKTRIEKLEKLRELCGDPFAVERYERDAELTIVDSDLNITMQSAKALHFAAAPNHCILTGGTNTVAINQ